MNKKDIKASGRLAYLNDRLMGPMCAVISAPIFCGHGILRERFKSRITIAGGMPMWRRRFLWPTITVLCSCDDIEHILVDGSAHVRYVRKKSKWCSLSKVAIPFPGSGTKGVHTERFWGSAKLRSTFQRSHEAQDGKTG